MKEKLARLMPKGKTKYIIIACVVLLVCISFVMHLIETSGALHAPASAIHYCGENYQDVIKELKAAGFTNIKTQAIDDLVIGFLTKDGEVEEISIDGDNSFSEGKGFDENVEVVIKYHTFPASKETPTPEETPVGSYRTETEKWLASSEYAECLKKGKFPVAPGNNPYGTGINESKRNHSIYYLDASTKGPWGKLSEYGDYEFYIPSGKYLVMNATNPRQYSDKVTSCKVFVCDPQNDDNYETYSFSKYGETQEITISDGCYVALTISATITLEPIKE